MDDSKLTSKEHLEAAKRGLAQYVKQQAALGEAEGVAAQREVARELAKWEA